MELQDISTAILIGQANFRTSMAQHAARKAQGRADDSHIAARIHGAAANAFADGNASLYSKLLASDLEVERLADKVDEQKATIAELTQQRAVVLRECQILLAENAALLARKH